MAETWLLEWSHGRATVHSAAGALGRTDFRLGDGHWVNPFHEAPWLGRAAPIDPPMLGNLRGDWACIPFGRPYGPADGLPDRWGAAAATPVGDGDAPLVESDALLHGYSSNTDWRLVSQSLESLIIAVDYPEDSPVAGMTRTLRPVAGEAALDVSVEVRARRPCRRPFGFHPNFALHGGPGSFRVEPGTFAFGLTHPTGERGVSKARPDTRFTSLREVPLNAGGSGPFDRLPFAEATEEIVQLCGIDGSVRLVDDASRAAWTLTFDRHALPSLLLWMSNRGRQYDPWNGQNLCLGVEPVVATFDLGVAAALAPNPIAAAGVPTALRLDPASPVSLGFRLKGEALP